MKELYDAVYDHVDKYACDIEVGQTDAQRWRVVVICANKPHKSASGMGRNCPDAYRDLARKLGLKVKAY